MITLSVDSSSKACSCAVTDEEHLLSECYLNNGLTHSRTLTALVTDALTHAALTPDDIGRFAVTNGPGSYTGLRIGLSAVKGMAFALGRPCVEVSTLLSLAYNLTACDATVCAVLDARVGQVFAALFEIRNGTVYRRTPDDALSLDALGDCLPVGTILVGDGAELAHRRFASCLHTRIAPPALRYQRASSAAFAARAQSLPEQDAAALSADYHRKSQAEREREKRGEG